MIGYPGRVGFVQGRLTLRLMHTVSKRWLQFVLSAAGGSGWQLSIQHTLQPERGGAQITEQSGSVIQLVILGLKGSGLKQRADACRLDGSRHAAAALDGVADAANFGGVAFGNGG